MNSIECAPHERTDKNLESMTLVDKQRKLCGMSGKDMMENIQHLSEDYPDIDFAALVAIYARASIETREGLLHYNDWEAKL